MHSLGVETFAEFMEDSGQGYTGIKLGPAVAIDDAINKIQESCPSVVGISIRLGDLHVDRLIQEFMQKALEKGLGPVESGIRYCFGGLRPAANLVRAMTGEEIEEDKFTPEEERHYDLEAVAEEYSHWKECHHFFSLIVDDYTPHQELEAFVKKMDTQTSIDQLDWSDDLLERMKQVKERENRPIIRAHIGIAADSIEPTVASIEKIAAAGAVEIISLAPDQPSQAFLAKFIRGEEDPEEYLKGQGGVPIRSREDLLALKEASQRGNYPTTRIYSGTDELLEMAKIFEETFHMPFPAVPIFFYNALDGRGPISIHDSFVEHFDVIRWWGEQKKPLEINDPHQWQLRGSTDEMYVVDHILAAVIAYQLGITDYVMQLMFDLPPGISVINDLAKMKAACELIEPLTQFGFRIIREARGGLSSFPPNLDRAKGHLAHTTHMQLYLEPQIIHVVSFSEAHHEATAHDIIESSDLVKQVIADFNGGEHLDPFQDQRLIKRKEEIKEGAMYNLLHLGLLGGYDGPIDLEGFPGAEYPDLLLHLMDAKNYPTETCGLISPDTLDLALQTGLFQAPRLTVVDKRYEMVGKCRTRIVDGACRIAQFNGVDVASERERVDRVRERTPWYFCKEVNTADDINHIRETERGSIQDRVQAFRESLKIQDVQDLDVLVVDFGSTFTKVGTFNSCSKEFALQYVPTTPGDLRQGLAQALGCLQQCEAEGSWGPLQEAMDVFDVRFPCSSAKGGLKMVTVSLVAEESGFAAELAALTAGAKLLHSYTGPLTHQEAVNIYTREEPELILLTGGVDQGGEEETQLHNARLLAEHASLAHYTEYGVPVIYAGNQDIASSIQDIFQEQGVDIFLAENVMPEVNTYNIETVNEVIRELFSTVIIRGKGFHVVEKYFDTPFLPTPKAAYLGVDLLAKGYGGEEGLGNIMALDIGGCTTDFYCNINQNPLFSYPWEETSRRNKRTILKTPNTPLAYRRVEGKFGMSYNAENLMELTRFKTGQLLENLEDYFNARFPNFQFQGLPYEEFLTRKGKIKVDLKGYLEWISRHPEHLPQSVEETTLRAVLAREIVACTTANNVGRVEETDTYFLQYGVNLFNLDAHILLIGGTIYHKCQDQENKGEHRKDLEYIATGSLYQEEEGHILRPQGEILLDSSYLVSIIGGLYGLLDPVGALQMMKEKLTLLDRKKRFPTSRISA